MKWTVGGSTAEQEEADILEQKTILIFDFKVSMTFLCLFVNTSSTILIGGSREGGEGAQEYDNIYEQPTTVSDQYY